MYVLLHRKDHLGESRQIFVEVILHHNEIRIARKEEMTAGRGGSQSSMGGQTEQTTLL
jgi:hypothetical protein